jgi:Uma2 family endonuclease
MITKFEQLDLTKQYTYADYLTWKFAERVELFKGWVLKMSPAPSMKHQYIAGNFHTQFNLFLKNNPCKVFVAPVDVRLFNSKKSTPNKLITSVVQPDVCIVCNPKKLDKKGIVGAPDLIIEVISKGNTKKELNQKMELYEENGVKEYWIVQQGDETVTVFDLVDDKFNFRKIYSNDEKIKTKVLNDFEIDLVDIFNW